ncbi:hypothetical protein Bhyg_15212 [Pseudolycoriella hygida]|uniref:Uncharacterized protein n=1 Tax=Pseudolycoriella hygida TaxID=35572 RepID=A0A9Q0MRG0_9DIPT|nr:hypothetical protein Bhyg_15212 [Pseudolycoriella hygida]
MKVLIFLLGAFTVVYATSPDLSVSESRNSLRQSSSPSPLNSLVSNQDGPTKLQSQQQVQQPQQSYNIQQDFSSSGQPHSTVYNHIQSGSSPTSAPQNGYVISVNPNGHHGAVGATPVLMQYLPQSQQTGGIQYLQLIPTRPLIVPISPYITQLPQYSGPPTAQPTAAQYASAAPAQSYPSYQNPLGGYSSPAVSYFRPHSGIQLVDAPIDMTLNTNEYVPIQAENTLKMRRA